jgi:polyisoprenoid-binding protein YceI
MALPIDPGTYGIDTMHSQIGFAIRHLGISVVRGTFDRYGGALHVGDDLAGTVVTIEAEVASLNSGNGDRDQHMLGPDWLDAADHPQMTFRSSSIDEAPGGYAMTGDLTIKAITWPVTFVATYNGSNTFPMDGSTHFGFAATGTISRTAFGTSVGVPMLSDEVELTLDVQFVRPPTDA